MLTEEKGYTLQNIDWFYNIGDDIKTVEQALKRNEPMKVIKFKNKSVMGYANKCPNCDYQFHFIEKKYWVLS